MVSCELAVRGKRLLSFSVKDRNPAWVLAQIRASPHCARQWNISPYLDGAFASLDGPLYSLKGRDWETEHMETASSKTELPKTRIGKSLEEKAEKKEKRKLYQLCVSPYTPVYFIKSQTTCISTLILVLQFKKPIGESEWVTYLSSQFINCCDFEPGLFPNCLLFPLH